jgi:uncharacterized protein (UPF0276 family)
VANTVCVAEPQVAVGALYREEIQLTAFGAMMPVALHLFVGGFSGLDASLVHGIRRYIQRIGSAFTPFGTHGDDFSTRGPFF